jgi:hypothetical protein
MMITEKYKCMKHKYESKKAYYRDGVVRSSKEASVIEVEPRDYPVNV